MSQNASSIRERFRFLSAALGPDADPLHVLRFSGTEGFSRLFSFDVSLATRRKKLDVDAMLASPAALCILRPGGGMARFTGYPTSLELSSSYGGWQFWTLRLQPALWKLTQQVESRIFLDCTVEELAKEVLDEASSLQIDYAFRLSGSYGKQEFSMQHNESLYDFLAWKLERDGIYWFFEETDSGSRVVFADAKEAHQAIPDAAGLRYSPASGLEAVHLEEVISSFGMKASSLPRRVVVRDYDWENPMKPVAAVAEVSDKGLGDVYFYGDGFTTQEEGRRLAEIRAQGLRCRSRIFRGESGVPAVRPGFVFKLENYFDEDFNRDYLVTEARHEGSQEAWLSQAVGVVIENAEDQVFYRNQFSCIPDDVPFRPERRTERAKVSGMLTAFIDGSSDSAVAEVNGKGCYKVVFPQDLSGRPNGKSSCWIRRMQPHVGLGHGMTFPLTPGVEVLVAFIDGNPDRPVIAGAVSNAVSGASESHASAQTTAIRTSGGSGLVFNDKETKQGLHLGTGGRSGMFMGSGSLDAMVAYSDFGGSLASGFQYSFAGLAQHAVSGFSSKLEASHLGFSGATMTYEILKLLSEATACFEDDDIWHKILGGKDQDGETGKTSQKVAGAFSALTDALKLLPAIYGAQASARALPGKEPFYGAAITSKQNASTVKLTTPMDSKQLRNYLMFAIVSLLPSLGGEAVKAFASYQSAEKIRNAFDGKGGIDLSELKSARWYRMGRSIAQSLATTLIPELVALIALHKKSDDFGDAKQMGGLLLCAQDSNAVVGARKETRVTSDEKLFLAAGAGNSIYSRYTGGDDLTARLEEAFGLAKEDSAIVQRADVLHSAAFKSNCLTALGQILAQAGEAITLTTMYDQEAIEKIIDGYRSELLSALDHLNLHVTEYGMEDFGKLAASIINLREQLALQKSKFMTQPAGHTTLKLGKSFSGPNARQEARLDCQGPGCQISLAGTATDTAGVFEAKMTNSKAESSLELKYDSAKLKTVKGADSSSLCLSSEQAFLNCKNGAGLVIDGTNKRTTLTAGDDSFTISAAEGCEIGTANNFSVNAYKDVHINGKTVSLLKGKVKFSNSSIQAEASGNVSIKGVMIKIG